MEQTYLVATGLTYLRRKESLTSAVKKDSALMSRITKLLDGALDLTEQLTHVRNQEMVELNRLQLEFLKIDLTGGEPQRKSDLLKIYRRLIKILPKKPEEPAKPGQNNQPDAIAAVDAEPNWEKEIKQIDVQSGTTRQVVVWTLLLKSLLNDEREYFSGLKERLETRAQRTNLLLYEINDFQ